MTDQELKTFNQGFLCAVVSIYDEGFFKTKDDTAKNNARNFLESVGGFHGLGECLKCEPDVYDAEKLAEIYGVGNDAKE
ncbi:hypothetical protein [uncultured Olegusella sp.]|uniref:hypothetical protein n=1 Tax=uncultured Olegusella sp. TaxID=1979846 RepID=UPI00261DB0E1|nr:hypothetical protein [uncultured Olegusella sp.]